MRRSAKEFPSPRADTGPRPDRRPRRGAELWLLIFAAVIVSCALVIVELNQSRGLSWDLALYGVGYLVALAVAHFLIRRFAPYADPVLLPLAALLNGIGLVMIYRIDLAAPAGSPSHVATTQLLWTGVALVCFLIVLAVVRDHKVLANYSYTLLFFGMIFLVIPSALPDRMSLRGGAKIWIIVGGYSIQPGEFAKVALIIFAAAFLTSKRKVLTSAGKKIFGLVLPRARDLGPLLVALLIALGVLVSSSDLGSALLLFGVLLVMIYLTTSRVSWLIIGLIGFAGGAYVAYKLFAHVQERVEIWLHPFANVQGDSYQLARSLYGLGTGGIFGTGLGAGQPNLVPEANSDFIAGSLGQEIGLVGLAAVLLCFLLLSSRGLRAAIAVKDEFGSLLAGGLSFALVFQMFIVVGGVTRLIPLTGLTTPFMSAGGSSLLSSYVTLALLVRISDSSRRPATPALRSKAEPLNEAVTEMVRLTKDTKK